MPDDKTVREVLNRAIEGVATYRTTFEDLVAPTGIAVAIIGATGVIVRIKTIHIDVMSADQTPLLLRKYSTAPTGGTDTQPGLVPLDSDSEDARATVNLYTVAPTEGTIVGEVFEDDILIANPDTARVHEVFGKGDSAQALTLRSAAEAVGIFLAAVSSPLNGYIEWTEEPGLATPTPGV